MRWEFYLWRAGATGDYGKNAIASTTYTPLELVCELAEETMKAEPAWADFFSNHRLIVAPYPPSGGRPEGYSLEETRTALEGMRSALVKYGSAWKDDPRWPDDGWGMSPNDLIEQLDSWIKAVTSQPAGTRLVPMVQDD